MTQQWYSPYKRMRSLHCNVYNVILALISSHQISPRWLDTMQGFFIPPHPDFDITALRLPTSTAANPSYMQWHFFAIAKNNLSNIWVATNKLASAGPALSPSVHPLIAPQL